MKIETAVDKIMELVRRKNKISVRKCAKELNMSLQAVEDWAKTLEEEGLIILQYKFGGPYLVEKKLTEMEQEKKIKKIDRQKDFFIDDSDVGITADTESLEKMNSQFKAVKKELESELDELRSEIKTIESGSTTEEKKFFIKQLNTINKRLDEEDKKMEKTVSWINFFKTKMDEQDQKIKKVEKKVKT